MRETQAARLGRPDPPNKGMSNRDIRRHAQLEPAAKSILYQAAKTFELSARAYLRIVKVARTIALPIWTAQMALTPSILLKLSSITPMPITTNNPLSV